MSSSSSGTCQPTGSESRHQCLIYDGSPSRHLPALAAVIQQKLRKNHRCLYLNSAPMVAGMRSSLAALDIDVEKEVARASLILSSEPISPWGDFNSELMLRKLEEGLDEALREGYNGLWATGDMAWEFGHKNNFAKLMDYEYRLEELMHRRPELAGICQYHTDSLPPDVPRQGLLTHRSIFVNATLSYINSKYVPLNV